MNIQVMNRKDAIRYSYHYQDMPSAIISISTPNQEYHQHIYRSLYNQIRCVLRLSFDDVEDGDYAITPNDTKKIHNFVEANKDLNIIIHCDAGISRSAGIAAALMKYYNGDDSPIFDNPRHVPNMRCYQTMLEELVS